MNILVCNNISSKLKKSASPSATILIQAADNCIEQRANLTNWRLTKEIVIPCIITSTVINGRTNGDPSFLREANGYLRTLLPASLEPALSFYRREASQL